MTKRAVLVASFGTSHLDTLEKTIQPIEWDIAGRMPGRVLRRAFTSGMILRKLEERDGLKIDSVPQALERLAEEGFEDVVVQPTHIMNGEEFDKLMAQAEPYRARFRRLAFGWPLLTTLEDYRDLTAALSEALPEPEADTAHIFMGHGTEHFANAAYCQLSYMFHDQGRPDVLVGTVEGYPGLEQVLRRLEERPQVRKVVLRPLMVVAGDHAKNDLAGDEEGSWKRRIQAAGYETACVLSGLGERPEVRALFVRHALEAEETGGTET